MLGVSLVRLSGDSVWSPKQDETIQISFIARGKKTESWSTIEQGIEQAANDLNVEITPIYLSSENDASEQISLLNREVQNGADAVLIAPANSEDLRAPIEEAQNMCRSSRSNPRWRGWRHSPILAATMSALGSAGGGNPCQRGQRHQSRDFTKQPFLLQCEGALPGRVGSVATIWDGIELLGRSRTIQRRPMRRQKRFCNGRTSTRRWR